MLEVDLKRTLEALAWAANGGSFPNEYAKNHTVRSVIRLIEALTVEELVAIKDALSSPTPR